MGQLCAECEIVKRLFLNVWFCSGWGPPGTSLGSPASVMTEHQWLANTSCGSPGSLMCHQQRRQAGAGRLLRMFSCVPAVLGRLMPFPERQGRRAGALSPSDSLCGSLKAHRCPLLSVLGQRRLPGTACSLAPYLFFHFVYVCMCVCVYWTPNSHPCGRLPPPGSHTHYQSPLMASN